MGGNLLPSDASVNRLIVTIVVTNSNLDFRSCYIWHQSISRSIPDQR